MIKIFRTKVDFLTRTNIAIHISRIAPYKEKYNYFLPKNSLVKVIGWQSQYVEGDENIYAVIKYLNTDTFTLEEDLIDEDCLQEP